MKNVDEAVPHVEWDVSKSVDGDYWGTHTHTHTYTHTHTHTDVHVLCRCEKCSGLLRPHVVWYGEGMDYEVLAKVDHALRNCDLFLLVSLQ